jgi:hypothetical protein
MTAVERLVLETRKANSSKLMFGVCTRGVWDNQENEIVAMCMYVSSLIAREDTHQSAPNMTCLCRETIKTF